MLFGEIVATAKAVIWPYYVFAVSPTAVSNEYPKLTANEIDVFSKIISKAQTEELSDTDIAALKNMLREYNKRTGTKMKKADVDAFTKEMEITNEYYYELGQSLLASWDSKSRFTTGNFDKMLNLMKESGARKPEKIEMDLVCLDAAAKNQNYVQNVQIFIASVPGPLEVTKYLSSGENSIPVRLGPFIGSFQSRSFVLKS